jgi:hypothetical protein
MIRLSKSDDIAAILSIAEAIGFQLSELDVIRKLLNDYFTDGSARDSLQNSNVERFWLLMSDLEAGIRLQRFQVESTQAAIDLVLGTALMAMRTILEGHSELNYPEQVTKLILKSLGVDSDDAEEIAFKALEPLPGCHA